MAVPPSTAGCESSADGTKQPEELKRQLKGGGVVVVVKVGVWDCVGEKVGEEDCEGVEVRV